MKNQGYAQHTLECIDSCKKKDWNTLFHDVDPDFIPLLKGLLDYDPERRLSAEDALKLPIFVGVECPSHAPLDIAFIEFEFENYKLGKNIFKELIQDEVLIYRKNGARRQWAKLAGDHPDGYLEKIYSREDEQAKNVKIVAVP
jgi:hypothetical protein